MKKTTQKQFVAFFVALCMVVANVIPMVHAADTVQSDLSGHWGEKVMLEWVSAGKLKGYGEGIYRPDASIKRAEFMALINRMYGYSQESTETANFIDVTEGKWYFSEVAKALSAGYASGSNGKMNPEMPITRQEAVKIILTAEGIAPFTDLSILSGAKDGAKTSEWAKGYMAAAMGSGILAGSDGYINPLSNITRAEAVTLLSRVETGARSYVFGPYGNESNGQGYVLFKSGVEKKLAVTVNVKAGTVLDSFTKEHLIADLPEGLVLAGAKKLSDKTIEITFLYEGKSYFAQKLDIAVSAEALEGYEHDVPLDLVFEVERQSMIPFGARAIRETGLGGAVEDVSEDIVPSKYYYQPDFFTLKSGGSLTMLSGYRTQQQATGWSCGVTAALTVIDWYGLRNGTVNGVEYMLNDLDLGTLRGAGRERGKATQFKELENVFSGLESIYGQQWNVVSTRDVDFSTWPGTVNVGYEDKEMNLFEMIPYYLEKGIPVLVGWQDWGGHYQVIIGYDTMGTEGTADDILVLADPYDTTDHKQDGYIIQPYERFIYDWSAQWDKEYEQYIFVAAWPEGYKYTQTTGGGLALDSANLLRGDVKNTIGFGTDYVDTIKAQIIEEGKQEPYATVYTIGDYGDGLSGPYSATYFGKANVAGSPYYRHIDFYNAKSEGSLTILEQFKTVQQASEYTCGMTSMAMVMEHFGLRGDLTEFDLSALRGKEVSVDSLPGSDVKEMVTTVNGLNKDGGKWSLVSSYDMDDEDCVEIEGETYWVGDMIPAMLEKGIPVMVMWHEWGGHWQVVIGYDDMGTEGTQDDVIILADPYDTTDHNQDGYMIESYERLIYDWSNSYDGEFQWNAFVVMYPEGAIK